MKTTLINPSSRHMGWVPVMREILDSPIIKSPTLCQIYLWCVLKANHMRQYVPLAIGKGTSVVECKIGQFITGRTRASEELGLPPSTYNNNFKKLEKLGYITIESNSHYSIVTVNNYDNWADDLKLNGQQKEIEKSNDRITNEQPLNTNNNENNVKNYEKDNSLINNIDYQKFLSDPIFEKSDKNFLEEFKKLVNLISNDLLKVQTLTDPILPYQFIELRQKYSFEHIVRKIKDLDSWKGFNKNLKLFQMLKTFLEKDRGNKEEKNKPKVSERDNKSDSRKTNLFASLYDSDGNTSQEISEAYTKYKDEKVWESTAFKTAEKKRRTISKWLRLNKYIQNSNLNRLKDLELITLEHFLKLSKYEEVYGLSDQDFEDMKGVLNMINQWPTSDLEKGLARSIWKYFKDNAE